MTAVEPKADTITVRNPADGHVVGTVPVDDAEAVAAKARELRLFQPEWRPSAQGAQEVDDAVAGLDSRQRRAPHRGADVGDRQGAR